MFTCFLTLKQDGGAENKKVGRDSDFLIYN